MTIDSDAATQIKGDFSTGHSFRFSHAILRAPSPSIINGLRAGDGPDPDFGAFEDEHEGYLEALNEAGAITQVLAPLAGFPDSVFIEDAALIVGGVPIVLRPGAATRFGEAETLIDSFTLLFDEMVRLEIGFVDGGDIMVTETEVLVGLSERTNTEGFEALSQILADLGIASRAVTTPPGVLHFKSDSGWLGDNTVLATARLAAAGVFDGYDIIETADGEEASANAIRVNDHVIMSAGYPKTAAKLRAAGFKVIETPTYEAARVDGGPSCMSLRFSFKD